MYGLDYIYVQRLYTDKGLEGYANMLK